MSSVGDCLCVVLLFTVNRRLLLIATVSLAAWGPFLLHTSADVAFEVKDSCVLGNNTSCPDLHCCVKHVITYKDPSKSALVGTKCESLLGEDALCLRSPEDYMCDCKPGLHCAMESYQTFGYCKRLPRKT